MKYQLVLQFPASSISDFDELIALEDDLIKALGRSALVDGHDFGSGEANIFVHTNEPQRCFDRMRAAVSSSGLFQRLSAAAFRSFRGENYTVLWPAGCNRPFRIT
jgi:hypothetical protein